MKRFSHSNAAFSLVEWLVAIAIFGILIFLLLPSANSLTCGHGMTETLSNARSLHQATQMMTLDSEKAGKGLLWTSVQSNGEMIPVSVSTYFDALMKGGYLTKSELRKILTAPGKVPGGAELTAENICFKIFQVEDTSPSDQPFVVTANWQDRELTDNAPYGKKGFVVFNKGGGGGIYNRQQDADSTNIFPHAENGAPGTVYRYVTLK